MGTLSESLEDYLEIILQLQQEKRVARVRDIAVRKHVSNASVSNALSRLARDGYVHHEAHEFVELTDRGAELARRILRRHEFLVSFLRDVLQVSPAVAEADACTLEHHVSAETLERLATLYQFVCSCPQVGTSLLDAFKACFSSVDTQLSPSQLQHWFDSFAGALGPNDPCSEAHNGHVRPLSNLAPGDVGIVVRISAPSSVRKRLVDAGVLPNVRVEVRHVSGDGHPMDVLVQGCTMAMDAHDAVAVMVRVD